MLWFRLKFPPATPTPTPASLFSHEQVVSKEPPERNVRPDLTHGKGTGPSPALGVKREGLFFCAFEHARPAAEGESLVEISPGSGVSFSDRNDPSRGPNRAS